MVTELHKEGETLYVCDACGFTYKEKELAERCQSWCEQHHSCNIEITRYAVPLE